MSRTLNNAEKGQLVAMASRTSPEEILTAIEKLFPPTVIITMEGGLIQDVELPKGYSIRVLVMDFDTDGTQEPHLKRNAVGDEYIETIYEGETL